MKQIKIYLLIILSCVKALAQNDTCVNQLKLGIAFPPVSDMAERATSQKHLDTLRTQLIRFEVNWQLREPTRGTYNWGPFDQRMQWVQNNNYSLLLTIQSAGPNWACDANGVIDSVNAFQKFVDTLLKRYPNEFYKIQFGNEVLDTKFWKGTVSQYIQLSDIVYNSVQQYAPQTDFVLAGFATGQLRRCAACMDTSVFWPFWKNNTDTIKTKAQRNIFCSAGWVVSENNALLTILKTAQYDWVDLHLYDDAENWKYIYKFIKDSVPSKPILASEFGGPHMGFEQPYSDSFHAARLFKYIKTLDSIGVGEAYYFQLIESMDGSIHAKSGLLDTSNVEKPGYYLFKKIQHCFTGIIEDSNRNTISVFPNPFSNECTVHFLNPNSVPHTLLLYDITGRLLQVANSETNSIIIKKNNLQEGIYFYELVSDKTKLACGKLIIE